MNSASPMRTAPSSPLFPYTTLFRSEGRSGGSGRGTRKESRAPPGSGSSTSGSHVVSCTDARPSPPTHFPPSGARPHSHQADGHYAVFGRKKEHGALVAQEGRAHTEN